MNIKDKYIDKDYSKNLLNDNQEILAKAQIFFSSLPEVNIQSEKKKCPVCHKMHNLFCLKCGQLLYNDVPQIELPIKLQIIHHQKEKHQKSSALPLQFLSKNVQITQFPGNIHLSKKAYVLYPHQDAQFVHEINPQDIEEIVAIDCTWMQTNQILEQIQNQNENVRFIKLKDYETFFWRYQHHNLRCLATVEAIYYFFKEFNNQIKDIDYLLYFYKYQFQQINNQHNNLYVKIEEKKQHRLQQKQQNKKQQQFVKN